MKMIQSSVERNLGDHQENGFVVNNVQKNGAGHAMRHRIPMKPVDSSGKIKRNWITGRKYVARIINNETLSAALNVQYTSRKSTAVTIWCARNVIPNFAIAVVLE